MINSVNLVGNLTKDAQKYTTGDGKVVAKFDIAVNAGKEKAHYLPIVAFGTPAEYVLKYHGKGSKVAISGYLSQSTYTAQDGTKRNKVEVVAQAIEGMANGGNKGNTTAQSDIPHATEVDDYDDMPF